MWVLISILLILLILFGGFLLRPIVLYIDTDENRFELFQAPVFKFFFHFGKDKFSPHMQLVGVNVPLEAKEKKTKKLPARKHKTRKHFHRSSAAWRFVIQRIIKSFTIKRFIVDLDTDDVVLNAQLVPLFLALSRGPATLSSNFSGRVYFHLQAENRPVRLLWIFIQFLTKK
ncbi:MAG TPA: hypothetical protein VFW11_03965 [Cyclobacteriaceae bacterium]|nr:hypothetical protein [Cyclobacteriaceae bacterium]